LLDPVSVTTIASRDVRFSITIPMRPRKSKPPKIVVREMTKRAKETAIRPPLEAPEVVAATTVVALAVALQRRRTLAAAVRVAPAAAAAGDQHRAIAAVKRINGGKVVGSDQWSCCPLPSMVPTAFNPCGEPQAT
jgi:hypothetical protein